MVVIYRGYFFTCFFKVMKKCICDNHQLTISNMILMAPSMTREPGSITCPACNENIRATKKSKVLFVVVLVVSFIGLGFSSAFWLPTEQSLSVIAVIGVGLAAHYLIIWPYLIELESTGQGKT